MKEIKKYDKRRLNPLLSFLQKKHSEFYCDMSDQLKETYKRQIMKNVTKIDIYRPKRDKKNTFTYSHALMNSYYIKKYIKDKLSNIKNANYNEERNHKWDLENAVIYQLIKDKLITPYIVSKGDYFFYRFHIYIDNTLTPKERFDKMFKETCERYNPGLTEEHKNSLYKILDLTLSSKQCFLDDKINHNLKGELLLVPNICRLEFNDNKPFVNVLLMQGIFKKNDGSLYEIEFNEKTEINKRHLNIIDCSFKTYKNKFISFFVPKINYRFQVREKNTLGINYFYEYNLQMEQKELEKHLNVKLNKRFFKKYLHMMNWYNVEKRKHIILYYIKNMIDQNIFKIMCSTQYHSSYEYYNYLNANGNNKKKIIRLQAVKSYPLLSNVLFKNKIVKQSIDNQIKLEDILSEVSGFSKPVIRHIAKQHVQKTGRHIKSLFLKFFNEDDNELENNNLKQYLLNNFLILQDFKKEQYKNISNKLNLLTQFLHWKHINPEHVKSFMNYKKDIYKLMPFFEFHRELSQYLGVFYNKKLYSDNQDIIIFYLIYGFNSSFKKMEDRLKSWENQNANIHDNLYEICKMHEENILKNIDINTNSYWYPLCDNYINDDNKESVICLNNYHSLIKEGKTMHHCVGGYSYLCMNNETHILSIKTKYGMSTAEIVTTTNKCHISQHYTKYNKKPHEYNEKLLNSFLKLNEGKIDYDTIRKRCINTLQKGNNNNNILLDSNNIEQEKQVWKLFQPYLSKDFENLDFNTSIKNINLYLKNFL
jgi:hypothetical protein